MTKAKTRSAVEDPRERYYAERVRAHSSGNPHIHWPSAEVVFNLIYTYDVVMAEITSALARFDLTPAGFNVLKILRRAGAEGSPLGELSKLLVVSKANVTGLIDVLEKRGLIERVSEPSDRRIRRAKITETGERLLDDVIPEYYPQLRAICSPLSASDMETLSELLTTLRDGARRASAKRAD